MARKESDKKREESWRHSDDKIEECAGKGYKKGNAQNFLR